jgi:hypothetical protein
MRSYSPGYVSSPSLFSDCMIYPTSHNIHFPPSPHSTSMYSLPLALVSSVLGLLHLAWFPCIRHRLLFCSYLTPNHSIVSALMFIAISPYPPFHGSRSRNIQGKVAELRQELNSGGKKDKNYSAKKIALKKIVANMTMSNNDMVALFPDVIGCMNLPSLEIKKMYVRTIYSIMLLMVCHAG